MTVTEDGRQESPPAGRTEPPWPAMGLVVLVLVSGAFATGWHFGRRWGRMVGW